MAALVSFLGNNAATSTSTSENAATAKENATPGTENATTETESTTTSGTNAAAGDGRTSASGGRASAGGDNAAGGDVNPVDNSGGFPGDNGPDFGGGLLGGPLLGGVGIGWFPLGPGDVFIPPFVYTYNYFNNVNINNTVINNTVINNVYNNTNTTINYTNIRIPNAVTVIRRDAFVNSLPVANAAIKLPTSALKNVYPVHFPKVAPVKTSVMGSAKTTTIQPSTKVLNQKVIAKAKPPLPAAPFSAKTSALKTQPGKPLSPKTLSAINGAKSTTKRIENEVGLDIIARVSLNLKNDCITSDVLFIRCSIHLLIWQSIAQK